jgi:PAS domain S-box-containing protein
MEVNSEAHYRALFETTLDGILIVDDAGTCIDLNDSMCRLLKSTREEILGTPFGAFIPPERLEEASTTFSQLIAEGSYRGEFPLRAADGSLVELQWSARARFVPGLHFCVARDITERKQAEQRLREREARFRHLFESSQAVMNTVAEGLYTVDAHGLVTYLNPAAEALFGWTSAELMGRKMHDVTHYRHPDGSVFPAEECAGLRVLREGTVLTEHEDVFIRRDGSFFPVVYSAAPLTESGKTVGVVVSFRDDSQRQQAEARNAAILETALDAIISIDQEGRVVEFNPAAEQIFGYPRAEALGQPMAELIIPPSLRERHSRGMAHYLATGEGPVLGKRLELTALRADGTEFPVELAITRISLDGPPVFTAYIRDVTERRKAEQALRDSETLYRTLGEAVPDFVWACGQDGEPLYVNQRWTEYTGLTRDQPDEIPMDVLHHPDDYPRLRGIWGAASVKGEPYEAEFRFRRHDGAYRWFMTRAVPVKDEQGQIVQWIGTSTDIHERKQAEEALRASEARLAGIIGSATDAIITVNETQEITVFNRAAEQIFRCPAVQALGHSLARFIPELLPGGDEAHARSPSRTEGASRFLLSPEIRSARRADGQEFPIEATSSQVVVSDRTYTTVFVRDITERLQAERRLACEHAITQVLAKATTLEEAAPRILETVCECLEAAAGNLWEVDAADGVLRCTAFWARSHSSGVERFQAASRAMTFLPGVGLPGRVWGERQTATITVLGVDPNFPRRQLIQAAGLASGLAFPLSSGEEVLGVMEFFTAKTFEPDRDLLQMLTAIGHDIGQFIRRRRTEHALAAERERLRVTLTSIGDAVIVTNAAGQATFLNPIAETLTGWRQVEAEGKALDQVFPIFNEETRQPAQSPVERVLREGAVVGLANHTLLIARDGVEKPIDDSAAPIRGEHGEIVGVVLVFRDVTERREAERALRNSQERLQMMVESVSDYAIFTLDLGGCITSWNTGAERVFGYSEGEVLGQSGSLLFTPEDRASGVPEREMETAGSTGRAGDDRWHQRKDGSRFFASGMVTPMHDAAGHLIGFTKVARDITERKRAEEALTEADRRKDEFLAMLAHELRNPLAPLRNAVQILRFRSGDVSTVERVREMMDRQVQHMTRLIDDLLDVSRITRGKIALRRERLDLSRLIRLNAEDHQQGFDAAGLTLKLQVSETPVWVLGDVARLTQVLDNLLENARKFTDRGGEVRVRLVGDEASGHAIVSVRDTGIGIEPRTIPGLFEVFAQADRSLDRSRGGLGLGLPLLKGLIELHGGRVEAHSEGIGYGAEFIFWLPQAEELPALSQSAAPLLHGQKQLRILVVEDNVDAAESLRMLLELSSYEVIVTHSGAAGVEVAHREQPDVVVCDIGLPGMDGFAVARALRENPLTAAARLIAVTGYGQEEDRQRAREAGFDDHLTKPVDPEVLLSRLEPGAS